MKLTGIRAVQPSRLASGECFTLRVKLLGEVRSIECHGGFNTRKPRLYSPFNRNVQRGIQYLDHALPEWTGTLRVDGGPALAGPGELVFDGRRQGVFPGDTRPIASFGPFRWTRPGFQFLKLVDAATGLEAWANPVFVSAEPPAERLFWGDPHWQTFFSDGIRCPEELYAFARDEAFLDFGALSDHMEAVTDRQWDYFKAVTDDFNAPGRFATLHGQEWTHHDPARGAPGHRNVYFRGADAPVLRSTEPGCDTLAGLWATLDRIGLPALAVPHHSANVVMGVDWEQGWNPRYEKCVEIYSVWGSSERSAAEGNTRPIRTLKGEQAGRHVVEALRRGYRLGFMGGGDIHDGRPGDDLHTQQPDCQGYKDLYPQGFTAVSAPVLSRESVFDALSARRCYAATRRGIYADMESVPGGVALRAAAEDGVERVEWVVDGTAVASFVPAGDPRVVEAVWKGILPFGVSGYARVVTQRGDFAWLSPVWG